VGFLFILFSPSPRPPTINKKAYIHPYMRSIYLYAFPFLLENSAMGYKQFLHFGSARQSKRPVPLL